MDPQLILFRRQYFQLFDTAFLCWPPKPLLRDIDVQGWLYTNLFDAQRNPQLPPESYQIRILKPLLNRIENAIEDPEEDDISDDLMTHLSSLMSMQLPAETTAVQQKAYVTFSCLSPSAHSSNTPNEEPTITLLERRHLISGSLTTGYRTWEAALHLGSYLLTSEGSSLIAGKNVLELGAGTGFISILCAKHLEAKHLTTTDGDEGVIESLKENLFLNELDDKNVNASVLRWGHGLAGSWVEEECETWPYDVVLGADITYEKPAIAALITTLRLLFNLLPGLKVLIAGAVRNIETFETFRQACVRSKFNVHEIDFEAKPMREQIALFYATAVPLKILSITGPDPGIAK
ncbi:putative methyltransferase-domain-containing protein [Neohortaea acidophila]|uniref:Putative methyltransferase-domain-containing protein n=1 Tax=Neohortaea acidophila TaxID=245834 RepID=A0A6A6PMX3_9PEZI|nr:putative methyltransferase-domain-containing protein [Neohortaea acidophila]KAF2481342.1 putative methyltransferase-domain-containing protein [Neohortaea acidophila]